MLRKFKKRVRKLMVPCCIFHGDIQVKHLEISTKTISPKNVSGGSSSVVFPPKIVEAHVWHYLPKTVRANFSQHFLNGNIFFSNF